LKFRVAALKPIYRGQELLITIAINSFRLAVLKSPFFKGGLQEQFLVVPPFSKGGLGGIRMIPLSENAFGIRYMALLFLAEADALEEYQTFRRQDQLR